MVDLVVIGTGRLANSVLKALAGQMSSARVMVVGRDAAKTRAFADLAQARFRALGRDVRVEGEAADLEADGGLKDLFRSISCKCVVIAASTQSPYEKFSKPSAWTALLGAEGFALALPFNAALPARVVHVLDQIGSDATLVNGSFPDAVNPILANLTARPLLGIGNVATIASFLTAPPGAPDVGPTRILAHHVHLSAPETRADELRIWHGDRPAAPDRKLLAAMRALPRQDLNEVAGSSSARMIAAWIGGHFFAGHVAGPKGLPGGYPVRLSDGRIELDLPPRIDRSEAVALNRGWARLDGIAAQEAGAVTLTPSLVARARRYVPDFPTIIPVGDHAALLRAEQNFSLHRKYLRGLSATAGGGDPRGGLREPERNFHRET